MDSTHYTPPVLQLEFEVPVIELKSELNDHLSEFAAYVQYGNDINIGENRVVSLCSPGGDALALDPAPDHRPFQPTGILKKCPVHQRFLGDLPGPLYSVRWIHMGPNCGVRSHQDNFRNFQHGILRLHVPLQTNENVLFDFRSGSHHLKEGILYFGDFSLHHEVINRSDEDRIHLVIDIGITPELLKLFPQNQLPEKTDIHLQCVKDFDFPEDFAPKVFIVPEGFLGNDFGPSRLQRQNGHFQLSVNNRTHYVVHSMGSSSFYVENFGSGRFFEFRTDSTIFTLLGVVKHDGEPDSHIYTVEMIEIAAG